MIRIRIELVPHGNDKIIREIGRMEIVNDGTGDNRIGNYDIRLFRRGSKTTIQNTGKIYSYPRKAYSIWVLLKKAIEAIGF